MWFRFGLGVAVILSANLTFGQFAPEVSTGFSTLEAGDPADMNQELTLFDGDEDFASLLMTFDLGSFDFTDLEVGDSMGAFEITVQSVFASPAGIIVARMGSISCDVEITTSDDDILEADVIATDVDDSASELIDDAGGDDPTDEVVFTIAVNGEDLTLEIVDTSEIPSATAFGGDMEIEWKLEVGYTHEAAGGTLTVTDTFTSEEDTTYETEETFELVGGAPTFMRGDVDANGSVSGLLDSLILLNWAFADGEEPTCFDAADVDNNGTVSALLDSLALLNWAFSSGDEPADPGPFDCGVDPDSDDDVECEDSTC